jgi:hypothetical protein
MTPARHVPPGSSVEKVELAEVLATTYLWLLGRENRDVVAETWAEFRQTHGRQTAFRTAQTSRIDQPTQTSAPKYWVTEDHESDVWPVPDASSQFASAVELIGTQELSALSQERARAELEAPHGELDTEQHPPRFAHQLPQARSSAYSEVSTTGPSSTGTSSSKSSATGGDAVDWVRSAVIFAGVTAVSLGVALSVSRRLIGLSIVGAILIGAGATLIAEYSRRSHNERRSDNEKTPASGREWLRPRAAVPVHVVRDDVPDKDDDEALGGEDGGERTGHTERATTRPPNDAQAGGLIVGDGAIDRESSSDEKTRTLWRQYTGGDS